MKMFPAFVSKVVCPEVIVIGAATPVAILNRPTAVICVAPADVKRRGFAAGFLTIPALLSVRALGPALKLSPPVVPVIF
jgi:hypothetical protein